MIYTKKCIACGKSFETEFKIKKKYCSLECGRRDYNKNYYKKNREKIIIKNKKWNKENILKKEIIILTKKCKICDEIFQTKSKRKKYCSIKCCNKASITNYGIRQYLKTIEI